MDAARDPSVLTEDFRPQPYWWDRAAPVSLAEPLPRKVDIAIVGSGVTGLSAARLLLRAGRSVAVFDAQEPGSARRGAMPAISAGP